MKKRTYVLLISSFILLLALGGVLWYGVNSVVTLKEQEGTLRGEMESWIKKGRQTTNLQNTLTEAKKVKGNIDEYFFVPTEENQITLISDLEKIIKDTGSTGEVKSLDVMTDYSKVIGSLSIHGEWNDVYHTLLALEAYPIKLNLDDVSISELQTSVENKGKKPIYNANVRFTITNIHKPN